MHNSTCLFVLAPSLSENPLLIFAFLSRTKAKEKKKKGIVKWNTIGLCSIGVANGVITGLTLHSAFSF